MLGMYDNANIKEYIMLVGKVSWKAVSFKVEEEIGVKILRMVLGK
jgi:hypothetical protein